MGVEEEHYLIGVRSQLHTSTLCPSSWFLTRQRRRFEYVNRSIRLHFSSVSPQLEAEAGCCCFSFAIVLTPEPLINTPPSLFCIMAVPELIHSHLIAMIRLHLMPLRRRHPSLRSSPFIMAFLEILLVCHADLVSHFGFMKSQASSPLISPPSSFSPSLHLSIYHSQG